MISANTSDLDRAIAEIEELDRPGCLDQWRKVFGRPPPKYLTPQFMKRVLIWELQTQMLGALSAKTERQLMQIASGKTFPAAAKPGSHLVREWNGRTYQVEVVEGGTNEVSLLSSKVSAVLRPSFKKLHLPHRIR